MQYNFVPQETSAVASVPHSSSDAAGELKRMCNRFDLSSLSIHTTYFLQRDTLYNLVTMTPEPRFVSPNSPKTVEILCHTISQLIFLLHDNEDAIII